MFMVILNFNVNIDAVEKLYLCVELYPTLLVYFSSYSKWILGVFTRMSLNCVRSSSNIFILVILC